MNRDLSHMFYPNEMRGYRTRRIDYTRKDHSYEWAFVGLAAAFLSMFVYAFFEPTEAEAQYGYAVAEPSALVDDEFCIQARADRDSLGKPFMGELKELCGV